MYVKGCRIKNLLLIMYMFICGYIRPNKYGDEKGKIKESMSA